jgi:hypothetical protein
MLIVDIYIYIQTGQAYIHYIKMSFVLSSVAILKTDTTAQIFQLHLGFKLTYFYHIVVHYLVTNC